jgi:hypothetical protein
MFAIREAQLDVLAQDVLRRFLVNLTRDLDAKHTLGIDSARACAEKAVDRSTIYGFSRHSEVSRYAHLMCRLGAGFDQDPALPWASFILTHPDLIPSVKLYLLEAKVNEITETQGT